MFSFLDQVCDQLNLNWAWGKVKKASVPGDIWIDEAELAKFEVNLAAELEGIANDLRSGEYHIRLLRPMAFPKSPDADGNARVRQYFNFSIRDQVAWVAVVNILGPHIDSKMPAWSYGNRLFRSTWVEEEGSDVKRRKVGPYRHSSGRIYRPFQQAWPTFRRHITLSAFAATRAENGVVNLDQDDLDELNFQRSLPAGARCPYIAGEYWVHPEVSSTQSEIYWASVDLEKFYPSINLSACVDSILQYLPESMKNDVVRVLEMLTKFELDLADWEESQLQHIEIDSTNQRFLRVPTGLLVSGFLANTAMLPVDHAVEQVLPRGRVAHFRYVDDHVVIATSFDELLNWLRTYRAILKSLGPGPDINPIKTEPAELGKLLGSVENIEQVSPSEADLLRKARESSRLDPEFPAPLMTKTIALVSAIGRTDFTILEENELGILSQQLEHLLLVDLPETEIPERTRLAFAATRLARVAEARLASPEMLYGGNISNDGRRKDLIENLSPEQGTGIDDVLTKLTGIGDPEGRRRLESASNRVFSLIRRVLRKSPDRVRLWTNALIISRRLGTEGLKQLFDDIRLYAQDPVNLLASHYILGNTYAVLAAEAIRASKILTDPDAAGWRRAASLRFLRNFSGPTLWNKIPESNIWFVERSYNQFCIGIYCAEWIIGRAEGEHSNYGLSFDARLTARGFSLLSSSELSPNDRVALVWWACKFELGKPVRRAPPLALHLAHLVKELPEAECLWSFFPQDIPVDVLMRVAKVQKSKRWHQYLDGWWLDALRNKAASEGFGIVIEKLAPAARVRNALANLGTEDRLPLPIWAEIIWNRKSVRGEDEWRLGEWTCLEIIRQAAQLLSQDEKFDTSYIERAKSEPPQSTSRCAHPFNFTLPAELADAPVISWQEWRQQIRRGDHGVVRFASKRNRLYDYRYAPLEMSPIGFEQNPIRGLGLCLLGLLSRSFLLPVQWNGPGHESVLRHLPQLLRNEITYSSGTLGILEACLQPRASENVIAGLYQLWPGEFDDDTGHDPVRLLDAKQLAAAIKVVQDELERNQISTLNHRLRQATPVSLMHLTGADWTSYFGMLDI